MPLSSRDLEIVSFLLLYWFFEMLEQNNARNANMAFVNLCELDNVILNLSD